MNRSLTNLASSSRPSLPPAVLVTLLDIMATYSSTFAATSLGLVMSGTFIGTSLTLSYMGVPSLLVAASTSSKEARAAVLDNAARSWQYIYDVGKLAGPAAGFVGSAAYIFAARALPAALATQKQLLYAAAVANILVAPFTVVFMTRTNNELIRRANAAKAGKLESEGRKMAKPGDVESYDTPDLLQRWSTLNAFRSVFPIAAAVLTVMALSP